MSRVLPPFASIGSYHDTETLLIGWVKTVPILISVYIPFVNSVVKHILIMSISYICISCCWNCLLCLIVPFFPGTLFSLDFCPQTWVPQRNNKEEELTRPKPQIELQYTLLFPVEKIFPSSIAASQMTPQFSGLKQPFYFAHDIWVRYLGKAQLGT